MPTVYSFDQINTFSLEKCKLLNFRLEDNNNVDNNMLNL